MMHAILYRQDHVMQIRQYLIYGVPDLKIIMSNNPNNIQIGDRVIHKYNPAYNGTVVSQTEDGRLSWVDRGDWWIIMETTSNLRLVRKAQETPKPTGPYTPCGKPSERS